MKTRVNCNNGWKVFQWLHQSFRQTPSTTASNLTQSDTGISKVLLFYFFADIYLKVIISRFGKIIVQAIEALSCGCWTRHTSVITEDIKGLIQNVAVNISFHLILNIIFTYHVVTCLKSHQIILFINSWTGELSVASLNIQKEF